MAKQLNEKMHLELLVEESGVLGAPFQLSGELLIHVVTEDLGDTNIIKLQGRLLGATAWEDLRLMTGNQNSVTDVSVWDEFRFNCTSYDSSPGRLITSAFRHATPMEIDNMISQDITDIKAVTDLLPDAGALTSISDDISDIKAVTDLLPDAGALTSLSDDIADIKAVTDLLPDAGALTSIAQEATLGVPEGDSIADDISFLKSILEGHEIDANRAAGKMQLLQKVFTDAADEGDVLLATATDQDILIESVIITANSAQTADLDSVEVFAGAAKVIELINAVQGAQVNLDAEDKQVSYTGNLRLAAGKTLVLVLSGTDTTPVALTVLMKYRSISNGGHLV